MHTHIEHGRVRRARVLSLVHERAPCGVKSFVNLPAPLRIWLSAIDPAIQAECEVRPWLLTHSVAWRLSGLPGNVVCPVSVAQRRGYTSTVQYRAIGYRLRSQYTVPMYSAPPRRRPTAGSEPSPLFSSTRALTCVWVFGQWLGIEVATSRRGHGEWMIIGYRMKRD